MSRSAHEEVIDVLVRAMESRIAATERYLDQARSETTSLTSQLVNMRKEGFTIVKPAPARQPVFPSASDEAINERAGRNPALRRHLIAYRNQQKALGANESDLADRITNWSDPDGDSE